MGYSGLKTWNDSDNAADATYVALTSLGKSLLLKVKEKGNECNTTGAVNVALFNEAFILPIAKQLALADNETLKLAITEAREMLHLEYEEAYSVSNEEWGGRANKQMHLRAYDRMLNNLDKSINIFCDYPEQWLKAAAKRRAAKRKK
jgi:hypothetical protein